MGKHLLRKKNDIRQRGKKAGGLGKTAC
jgi:hypothetical protein